MPPPPERGARPRPRPQTPAPLRSTVAHCPTRRRRRTSRDRCGQARRSSDRPSWPRPCGRLRTIRTARRRPRRRWWWRTNSSPVLDTHEGVPLNPSRRPRCVPQRRVDVPETHRAGEPEPGWHAPGPRRRAVRQATRATGQRCRRRQRCGPVRLAEVVGPLEAGAAPILQPHQTGEVLRHRAAQVAREARARPGDPGAEVSVLASLGTRDQTTVPIPARHLSVLRSRCRRAGQVLTENRPARCGHAEHHTHRLVTHGCPPSPLVCEPVVAKRGARTIATLSPPLPGLERVKGSRPRLGPPDLQREASYLLTRWGWRVRPIESS
jgi:hypothetical protein